MRKLLLIVFCFISVAAFTQSASADEAAIRKALEEDAAAWNTGDLNAFMETYDRSDSLMFIGGGRITYGWDKTLANYKRSYPDTAAMGKLRFQIVEVKRLSKKFCSVVGHWFLTRTAGDLKGSFTLLWEKKKGKWVIIQDHSS